MKKVFMTICMTISALFILVIKQPTVTAYATNTPTLDVVVKCITASEASAYNSNMNTANVQCAAGDYAVSLVITNNTGYAATGYQIIYNKVLGTAITYAVNRPIYCVGNVLSETDLGIVPSVNLADGIFGLGTMGTVNECDSGVIITFFIRPSEALSLEDEQELITSHHADRWLDTDSNPVIHTTTNGYTLYSSHVPDSTTQYWIIGDIDQDGEITAVDAQLILSLYTDYTVTDGQIIYTSEYNGTYTLSTNPATTADGIYVVTVSDVNSDGVVDVTDASLVLQYYTDYEVGQGNLNNYNGLIGTETGVYIEYTVTFD